MKMDAAAEKSVLGFTLLEVLTVVAIVIALSGLVVFNLSNFRESSALQRSADEFGFAVRRAQNMAIYVKAVKIGNGNSVAIPRAVGIRVTTSTADADGNGIADNAEYFFFADQNSNRRYDGVNERIQLRTTLPSNITITSVGATPSAHIIFYTPEATLKTSDAVGNLITNLNIDVVFTASSGRTLTAGIRSGGRVDIF
jgi:type II secretory pathway pseudopilin PulG